MKCPNIGICQNICSFQHSGNGHNVSVSEIRKIQISICTCVQCELSLWAKKITLFFCEFIVFVIGTLPSNYIFHYIFILSWLTRLNDVTNNFRLLYFMDVQCINLCRKTERFCWLRIRFNLEIDWQNTETGKYNTERSTVSFLEQLRTYRLIWNDIAPGLVTRSI